MALRKMDLRIALETEIPKLGADLRQKDNSFVCANVLDLLDRCCDRKYSFCGYCNNPKYAEHSGVVLVLSTQENKRFWVHVPKGMFGCWCTQVGVNWQKHPVYREFFKEMHEEENKNGKKRANDKR